VVTAEDEHLTKHQFRLAAQRQGPILEVARERGYWRAIVRKEKTA